MKAIAVLMLFGFIQNSCQGSPAGSRANLPTETPEAVSSNAKSDMKNNDNKESLAQLCQAVLDLDKLQEYLHPEEPERKPLRVIRNSEIKGDLKLRKFDQAVEFISADEAKKKNVPALEFTSIEIDGNTATVEFRYAVEGIRGKAEFKQKNGKWDVASSSITES